jgi:hypothetical protein
LAREYNEACSSELGKDEALTKIATRFATHRDDLGQFSISYGLAAILIEAAPQLGIGIVEPAGPN